VNNADGIFLGPMPPRQALANSRNVRPPISCAALEWRRISTSCMISACMISKRRPNPSASPCHRLAAHEAGATAARLCGSGRRWDPVRTRLCAEQKRAASRRVMSEDTARLVTSMLADPQARLRPSRAMGRSNIPSPSREDRHQPGYRDAWTLAFSKKYVIACGSTRGRGNDEESAARRPAQARACAADAIACGERGEIDGEGFPSPRDARRGSVPWRRRRIGCSQTLREWVKPGETPVAAPATILRESEEPRLAIATPEHNTHIWRNPEQPPPSTGSR